MSHSQRLSSDLYPELTHHIDTYFFKIRLNIVLLSKTLKTPPQIVRELHVIQCLPSRGCHAFSSYLFHEATGEGHVVILSDINPKGSLL